MIMSQGDKKYKKKIQWAPWSKKYVLKKANKPLNSKPSKATNQTIQPSKVEDNISLLQDPNLERLKAKNLQLRDQNQQLNDDRSELSNKKSDLTKQKGRIKNQISIEQNKIKQKCSKLKQMYGQQANQIQAFFELTEKQEQLLQKKNDCVKQLQEQITDYQQQRSNRQRVIPQIKAQIDSLKKSTQKTQAEIHQNKFKKAQVIKQITKIKEEISAISNLALKEKQQLKPNNNFYPTENRYLQLFAGNILQGEDDYKEYLTEILERRTNAKVKGTKLIYRFDSLNKVNFHKYIDSKAQIVVLVKLKNGYTLGAWSEGQFKPKMVSEKDALIFSLTNRKAFEPLERNRRAIAYDDFFLIFGNSQLRLKSQEIKVFSNFAISNGYYDTRGQKVNILLGSGTTREVEMQGLEVFQLDLK